MFLKIKKQKFVIFSIMLFLPLVFASTYPVQAAVTSQVPSSEMIDENEPPDLEEILQRLNSYLEKQTLTFEKVEEMLVNAQTRIEELKSGGQDTSILEENLTELRDKVAEAQQDHELAGQILSKHPGFDETGALQNETIAREALSNAARLLQNCQQTLQSAVEQAESAREEYILSLTPNCQELEEYFQKATDNLDFIQTILDNSTEKLEAAAEKLDDMEKDGKDIVEYKESLEIITGIIDETYSRFVEYKTLIESHPGFDSGLLVEDSDLARETVFTLRDIFQEMQGNILSARQIFKINSWLFNLDFPAQ